MLAKLSSYTLVGIDAVPVEVEVDISATSNPKTVLVGLAEAAVQESTHRVERAIVNSGYRRPIDRIIINLAPADLKKDAGGFDLPIALGMLMGNGQAALDRPGSFAVVGELGSTAKPGRSRASRWPWPPPPSDGAPRPLGQRRRGGRRRGHPDHPDRQPVRGGRLPLGCVEIEPTTIDVEAVFRSFSVTEDDFSDVKGQDYAKRAC